MSRESLTDSVPSRAAISLFEGLLFHNRWDKAENADLSARVLGSFLVLSLGTCLGLASSLLAARLLSTDGFGTFAWAMALTELSLVPSILGWDSLLIRHIASYPATSSWGLMRGLIRRAYQSVILTSCCVAALGCGLIWSFRGHLHDSTAATLLAGCLLIPLISLLQITEGAIRGLHWAVVGQLPNQILRPILFICGLLAIYATFSHRVNAATTMLVNVWAIGICFSVHALVLKRLLPRNLNSASPHYQTVSWVKAAISLMLLTGTAVINGRADVIVLGAFRTASETGVYSAAARAAVLVSYVLLAYSTILGPMIASLHSRGEMAGLQRLLIRSSLFMMAFSLPIGVAFVAFGTQALSLFGPNFSEGATTLAILSVGQAFHAATGPAGLMLVMTGHERDALIGFGSGAGLNIALNLWFVPLWGGVGAACATTLSLLFSKILLSVMVHQRLGIHANFLSQWLLRGSHEDT